MRRVTQAMVLLSLSLVIGVAFQNCSGYEAVNNPLYDQSSVMPCQGLACGLDTSMIRLAIANDAITVKKISPMPADCASNDSRCVDVGGYCDDGGFQSTAIFATLSGGTVNIPTEFSTGAKCVDGRFTAQVRLPDGYDYDNMHTLRLTIYGYDSAGVRYSNDTGGNYRDVLILSYQ